MDGPGGTILTELQKDSRYPEVDSKFLILYLLEVLMGKSGLEKEWGSHKVGPSEPQKGYLRGHLSKPLGMLWFFTLISQASLRSGGLSVMSLPCDRGLQGHRSPPLGQVR